MVKSKKEKLKKTRKRNSKKTKVKRKANKHYSNKMTHKKTRKRNKKTKRKKKNKKTINQKLNRNQNKQLSYQFGGFLPNNLYNHLLDLRKPENIEEPLIEDSIFKGKDLDRTSFFGNSAEDFDEGLKNLQQHYRYVNGKELPESINMKNIAMISSHNTEVTTEQFNPFGRSSSRRSSGRSSGRSIKSIGRRRSGRVSPIIVEGEAGGEGEEGEDYKRKYTHLLDDGDSSIYGRIDKDPIFRFIKEYCANGIGCIELDLIESDGQLFVTHKVISWIGKQYLEIELGTLLNQIINILNQIKCILVINFDNTQIGKNRYNETFKKLLLTIFKDKKNFLLDGSIQDTNLKQITNGKIVFRMERALFIKNPNDLTEENIMEKLGLKKDKSLKHLIKGENTKTLTNTKTVKRERSPSPPHSPPQLPKEEYVGDVDSIEDIKGTISRTYPDTTKGFFSGKNYPILWCMYHGINIPAENFQTYNENLAIYLALFSGIPFYYYPTTDDARGIRPIPINITATLLERNMTCIAFKFDSDSIIRVEQTLNKSDQNVIEITKTDTAALFFPVLLFTHTTTDSGKKYKYHSAVRLDGAPDPIRNKQVTKNLVFFPDTKPKHVYFDFQEGNIPDPRYVKKEININYLDESFR